MRVLYFYPWGKFFPATCGADYVACNQIAYFQERGFEVHCMLPKGCFARNPGDISQLRERFPCIQSIRWIDMSIAAFTLREVLFAFERAARSVMFQALAAEPFDLFFANYVLSEPFACALPRSLLKVVETHDIQAGMYRTVDLRLKQAPPPPAIQGAEERFVYTQVELDLYEVFDRAVMISRDETEAIQTAGYSGAVHVPQPFPVLPGAPREVVRYDHDLVFVGSENHLNSFGINWFYRHVYVPYLHRHRVRLAIAGRVCDNFPSTFEDAYITKLGFQDDLEGLYDASKLVVVPIFEGTGSAIKLHEALAAGRAVVSTPVGARGMDPESGAFACVDMKVCPQQTAELVLDLLADDRKRRAMQHRAVALMAERHSLDAYRSAMDVALNHSPNRLAPVAA